MELVVLWWKCFVDGRDGRHAAQRAVDTRTGLSRSGGGAELGALSELLQRGPGINHIDGAGCPLATREGSRAAAHWEQQCPQRDGIEVDRAKPVTGHSGTRTTCTLGRH
jgi:hypothetical protein